MKSIIKFISPLLFFTVSSAIFAVPLDKPAPSSITDVPLQRLGLEIMRIAKFCGGTVGVCAFHIESQRRIVFNENELFPMASTYKVAIAIQLLTRIDQGEITLDQIVELKQSDFHPGSGTLTALLSKPGVSLSIRNLLELMLLISDNSATDILLRLAGGAEAVTARLRTLGIQDIVINRPTIQIIADWVGFSLPPEAEWTPELYQKLEAIVTPESKKAAAVKFDADQRDTTTPDAMVSLLTLLYRGEILKQTSGTLLLDIMQRCQTGDARLKGMLPNETVVAHKTGTIGGVTNDVGIITLPYEAGHVAIAVLVKASEKEVIERERGIAQIARAIYDFFLFNTSKPVIEH